MFSKFNIILPLILVFQILSCALSAKILGIFPGPTKSHFIMYKKVMEELANRGHEVDVISHFPLKQPMHGYNDISIAGSLPLYVNNLTMDQLREQASTQSKVLNWIHTDLGVNLCQLAFELKEFKDLLSSKKKYDLFVTELFASDCMLGYGHHFQVPTVMMTSSVDLPWGSSRIGNPDHPAYMSNYFNGAVSETMAFIERAINALELVSLKLYYEVFNRAPQEPLMQAFFGSTTPSISALVNNISLILLNSHHSFQVARPFVPNVIEVGGLHISNTLQPLPKAIEDIMNIPGRKGVIYISLGSMILIETLDLPKLSALFNAMTALPEYTFLLKASRDRMPKQLPIPKNAEFETWLPQLEVICHSNTKIFITHAGLLGVQEGVYCGKPMIGIPYFADQMHNVNNGVAKGFMMRLDYNSINNETVLPSLNTILGNERYQRMATRVSKLFRDRPQSAIDTAIFWIEYIIRHDKWSDAAFLNRPLRSPAADLWWFQYYYVDLTLLLALLIYAAVCSVRMIVQTLCKSKTSINVKKTN